ncbi:hypothetical protein EDD86DRAFT_245902 [Gorgonomyces haynaldii]|nr:hypothetical protein EDD86DRAFT_245902 [Gorgonomyces haynaldii]
MPTRSMSVGYNARPPQRIALSYGKPDRTRTQSQLVPTDDRDDSRIDQSQHPKRQASAAPLLFQPMAYPQKPRAPVRTTSKRKTEAPIVVPTKVIEANPLVTAAQNMLSIANDVPDPTIERKPSQLLKSNSKVEPVDVLESKANEIVQRRGSVSNSAVSATSPKPSSEASKRSVDSSTAQIASYIDSVLDGNRMPAGVFPHATGFFDSDADQIKLAEPVPRIVSPLVRSQETLVESPSSSSPKRLSFSDETFEQQRPVKSQSMTDLRLQEKSINRVFSMAEIEKPKSKFGFKLFQKKTPTIQTEIPRTASPVPETPQSGSIHSIERSSTPQSTMSSDAERPVYDPNAPLERRLVYMIDASRQDQQDKDYERALITLTYVLEQATQLDVEEHSMIGQKVIHACKKLGMEHLPAAYFIAPIIASGISNRTVQVIPPNPKAAIEYCLHGDRKNDINCIYLTSKFLEQVGDHRRANHYLKKASINRYGIAMLKGELGVPVDKTQAVKWLCRASQTATKEHSQGLYDYATLHEFGIPGVVFKDHPFMLSLLQDGCAFGNADCHALFQMALYLDERSSKPRVVPPDPILAFSFCGQAALLGHVEAMMLLGSFFKRGYGTNRDDEKAQYWIDFARDKGFESKQCTIL